jgi:4'-phosphopantetheinyl transferase
MANSAAIRPLAFGDVHLRRWAIASDRSNVEACVRAILSEYVGLPASEIRIVRGAGRPALSPGVSPDLSFNLSHSHRVALLAVTRGARVGVDLEWVRLGVRGEAVSRRFFAEREAAALAALAEPEREAAFFRTWVRKEAYIKAIGASVPAGLSRFSVSVAGEDAPAIQSTELEDDPSAFSLYDLDLPAGYMGAVAVEGTDHRIRWIGDAPTDGA